MSVIRTVPVLLDGLFASGPHPSLGEHAATYGRLIGSWAGEYRDFDRLGQVTSGEIEVHFAWVLQGLAVQDLWIAPSRAQRRAAGVPADRDTYGSTLRVFDAAIEAWRVVWHNPQKGVRVDLVGRRVGADVVQTGFYDNAPIKWLFTKITEQSFFWQAFSLEADGVSWFEQTQFRLRRVASIQADTQTKGSGGHVDNDGNRPCAQPL
jgi:hypothetical protein